MTSKRSDPAMDESEDPQPESSGRVPSRGRAFVYVIPCRNDSLLKLGFSRDPLARLETLHPRYYEFFELDAAFLVETDRVAEARGLELRLGAAIAPHSAPAPLIVPASAAGHTEWYRGAYEDLARHAALLREQGYIIHNPLEAWLKVRLLERAGLLFSWSANIHATLTAADLLDATPAQTHPLLWPVRNVLDAYTALGLSPQAWVSPAVWIWYQQHCRDFP